MGEKATRSPFTTPNSGDTAEGWTLQTIRRLAINAVRLCSVVMVLTPIVACFFYTIMTAPEDQISVHYGLPVGAAGVFLSATIGLFIMLHHLKHPYAHPALRWPAVGTPEQVAASIDAALKPDQEMTDIGYTRFTPTWILSRPDGFQFQTMPVASIVWAYLELKTTTHNGIPTSQTYIVKIHSDDGRVLEMSHLNLTGTKEKVEAMMANIAARAPWAIIGFSEERKKQWEKNRAGFLQTVATRRDTLERTGGAPDAAALRA